jgi:hypothetical protein
MEKGPVKWESYGRIHNKWDRQVGLEHTADLMAACDDTHSHGASTCTSYLENQYKSCRVVACHIPEPTAFRL